MRLPALLLVVLLGAGLSAACEGTGGSDCRPAAAAAAVDGEKLPESLRDEWFRRVRDELGLEPGDPDTEYPQEMRSDRWWKKAWL